MAQQLLSGFRQLLLPPALFEQVDPDLLFQALHVLSDRRLGAGQLHAGLGKTVVIDHGNERAQQFEIEDRHRQVLYQRDELKHYISLCIGRKFFLSMFS